ncbi:MAG TPA: LysR family transcriptional regulator [Chromatiales bacterium]|nr:LysR family transcriptional regulator [Chromatiales bacterium]HEX23062.1 LysR family transcriptional regulator [Chromatiales bacterium]
MHLTLRQLKVFEAVARHLSFRRAAEELHLSQPAVSMQIKQLESNVELPLFDHVGKKVFLTEAGREMFHYSRAIAGLLDEADEVIKQLKGARRGKLALSVASTVNYFAPALLGTFCRRFPDITISLDVTNRETLLRQLADNEADLVIMGQPPAGGELEAGAFMENPLVVIAPPDHPLAGKQGVPMMRLQDETFLVRERGSGTRGATERFFSQHGITLNTGMEISSNEAIKQSVQAGLGLGLLSRDTLEMELALNKLVVLDVEGFPIVRHWYVMHRRAKRLSPVAEAFKQFLLEEANTLLHPDLPGGGASVAKEE